MTRAKTVQPIDAAIQTNTVTKPGFGDGPPLVLVHGVGLDHTMWDLVAPILLADRRGPRAVTAYDFFGHGETCPSTETLTMQHLVDQLLTVSAAVAPETLPDIAGLSLGGAIVRAAAARHPDRFGRVVVANAVFNRSEEQRKGNLDRLKLAAEHGMGPVADLAIARWFTKPWQQAHPDRLAAIQQRIITTDLAGYLAAYRVFADGDPAMPGLLPALINDTLVVTGERDTGSTPTMTEAMAEVLPNGAARVLPSLGHLPPIECPETFAELLLDFLENARS